MIWIETLSGYHIKLNNMIIYLSIPMAGKDESLQRRTSRKWQRVLESEGHRVINPFDLADELDDFHKDCKKKPPTYKEYLDNDIREMKVAQGIFFCNGWSKSFGCMEECDEAIRLNLKVRFESHEN